jgi:hypothetical protein
MAKILLISYYVNVDGIACSHHIDDRINELILAGHCVTVISASFAQPLSNTKHFRYFSISPGGLRFEIRQKLKDKKVPIFEQLLLRTFIFLNQIPYAIERLAFRRDVTWSWSKSAIRGILRDCKKMDFDLIYSTGGPAVAHLVALKVSALIKVPWVAELQDPLIHDYCAKNSSELQKLLTLEIDILKNTIKSIFLTKTAAIKAEARTQIRGKACTIYSGAPACSSAKIRSTETLPKLTLAHFGTLGGIRNLANFIEGVKIAIGKRPRLKSELLIYLHGYIGIDDKFRIENSGLSENFSEKGMCTRKDALTFMRKPCALLLIQGEHPISVETIPSKAYEYLNTGKTIFALVHKNNELNKMISSSGGIVAEVSNSAEISSRLLELHESWSKKGHLLPCPINQFLVKDSVEKMLSVSLFG